MRKMAVVLCLLCAVTCHVTWAVGKPSVRMPANAPDDIQLAIRLLQSPEPEDRGQTASWLGSYGEEAKPAVPYLIKLLGDTSNRPEMANSTPYGPTSPSSEAMRALELMGKIAVPGLLDALKDPNPEVPHRAVQMLGRMFEARSEKEDRDSVRRTVMIALGEMKCQEALAPMLDALKNGDTNTRRSAMQALVYTGTDKAIEGVLSALKDSDGWIRDSTARELGRLKEHRAVEPLLDLLNDEEERVVSSAIYALGEIGDKRAIEPLKKLMQDKRWFIRSYAAGTLIMLGDRSQCEALVQALKSDKPEMDEFAASAVSEANDPSVIDAALSAIKDRRNVRLAFAALKKAKDPRIIPAMIGLLDSRDGEVFRDAADYLGASKVPAAVDALIAASYTEDEVNRTLVVVYALQTSGDKRATTALLSVLPQSRGRSRGSILSALATLGVGAEAEGVLIAVLTDEDAGNRWYAARLLGGIETDASVTTLTGALKDKNPGVRSKAAESLGILDTDSSRDALIAELMNPDSYIRPDAVRALGRISGQRVEGYLNAALTDNSEAVRRQAAAALEARKNPNPVKQPAEQPRMSDWGSPPAMWIFRRLEPMYESDKRPVPVLIEALGDPDPAVRTRAVTALQARKDSAAVEPLIKVLQTDSSNQVRIASVYALRMIGDPRSIPPMLDILKPDPLPQTESKPIITADRAVLNAIARLLGHDDENVVQLAHEALRKMTAQDLGTDESQWSEWIVENVKQ